MTDSTNSIRTITLEQLRDALKAQGHERLEDCTVRCPRCGTLQSAQDLIDAGQGESFEDVAHIWGFSCIGRYVEGKGCDWTLGGLFQIHELEILQPDGTRRPCFVPATEEAPS